ncbi:hypothetical protein SDC9_198508 [bioreactor metagenome]|uniref:Uncharacterized protein n=1 Tax=bioreactor metagenome TaxID=1076179 RepID=A0A645IHT8_9ZZZZ
MTQIIRQSVCGYLEMRCACRPQIIPHACHNDSGRTCAGVILIGYRVINVPDQSRTEIVLDYDRRLCRGTFVD